MGNGMVELAGAVIASPHQRQHLAGVRIQRHQRDLGIIDGRGRHPAFTRRACSFSTCSSTTFMPSVTASVGHPLQIRIERGVDAQAVMVEIRIAHALHQPVAHQVDEIRRLTGIDVHRR